MGPNPVRKLSKPGHRHMMAWGGEMAVYKPGTGTWNMSFLHSPQKEPTLPFKCLCINLRHFLDLPQFPPPSPGGTACSSVSKQRPSKPTLFCSASGLALSAFSNTFLSTLNRNLDLPPQSRAKASPEALGLLTLFLPSHSLSWLDLKLITPLKKITRGNHASPPSLPPPREACRQ